VQVQGQEQAAVGQEQPPAQVLTVGEEQPAVGQEQQPPVQVLTVGWEQPAVGQEQPPAQVLAIGQEQPAVGQAQPPAQVLTVGQEQPAVGQEQTCPLPPSAVWCEVRLQNLAPFYMAVYDWNAAQDWVSYNICASGFWEESDMSQFGAPGKMLDIGGNIGYYSFAFAQAGWEVITFEPMSRNIALMRASLCRNPVLAARIRVNEFGLCDKTQQCKMMVPHDNVGDGFTKCGVLGETQIEASKFVEAGQFIVRRLDEVLLEQGITRVDLVKIDVEGYEYQVFLGAPNFLTKYQPRLIKSEVWYALSGATGHMYLSMFESAGYKFFSDSKCEVPMDAKEKVTEGGIDVVICKSFAQ
jgi:FkbM family methyltransferase